MDLAKCLQRGGDLGFPQKNYLEGGAVGGGRQVALFVRHEVGPLAEGEQVKVHRVAPGHRGRRLCGGACPRYMDVGLR